MRTRKLTLTISVDTASSSAQLIAGVAIQSIEFPSAWTATDPLSDALVKVQGVTIADQSGTQNAPAESDWKDLVDESGATVAVRVQTGKIVVLSGIALAAVLSAHWIRLVADSTQAAARTIYLIGTQGN